jgi:hypothetical protein
MEENVTDCAEHGDELSGSVKFWEFLEWLAAIGF